MKFHILAGTPGLTLEDVSHLLVPGRGRAESGSGLTPDGIDRVRTAGQLHRVIASRGGRIVCSGYKSPVDTAGRRWSPPDCPGESFIGIPEADLMRRELLRMGIPAAAVRVERHSIDTVTNFLRSELEGHFGDDAPVAIVAQRQHLRRMLSLIAPRTLQRPYLGVVVPEPKVSTASPVVDLVSRLVLLHLPQDPDQAVRVATDRAALIWRIARVAGLRRYP
ncbi:YdcF family protein [Micromonospora terminaliae]|nr:YdcF family protein [Micromonospora terminaliae]NES29974.1 YdcF family protein [Micromonospora terminaliae]